MKRIHLLSCANCKRQLDVTALELGDEVLCVCDTLHVVGEPKLVQVRGLACGRCGGTLREGETSCGYCRAALAPEEREVTTLCPVCATRLPNDSLHCNQCGVSLRAAAVPALPRGGECPRCRGGLRIHLMPDAELIECGTDDGCGGIWCTRETFERMMQNVRQAVHRGDIGPSSPAERAQSFGVPKGAAMGYVPCLSCGDLMQRRQFRFNGRPSRVVIDICRHHGVWFDKSELQSVLAFIRNSLTAGEGSARIETTLDSRPASQKSGVPAYLPAARTGSKTQWKSPSSFIGDLLEAVAGLFLFP